MYLWLYHIHTYINMIYIINMVYPTRIMYTTRSHMRSPPSALLDSCKQTGWIMFPFSVSHKMVHVHWWWLTNSFSALLSRFFKYFSARSSLLCFSWKRCSAGGERWGMCFMCCYATTGQELKRVPFISNRSKLPQILEQSQRPHAHRETTDVPTPRAHHNYTHELLSKHL